MYGDLIHVASGCFSDPAWIFGTIWPFEVGRDVDLGDDLAAAGLARSSLKPFRVYLRTVNSGSWKAMIFALLLLSAMM